MFLQIVVSHGFTFLLGQYFHINVHVFVDSGWTCLTMSSVFCSA